jgi:hypothetical protein
MSVEAAVDRVEINTDAGPEVEHHAADVVVARWQATSA